VIVATGASSVALGPGDPTTLDPTPFLRSRKTRKFMGTQDDLAVVAAAGALRAAGLGPAELGERAGLFAVIGYIPFNRQDIDPVLEHSLEGQQFSMARFSNGGFQQAHPLLTFRCLPNMPAFHVSSNFDVQGPYFVSYPGPGQVYAALEEATIALEEGRVEVALVLAVAHQRNFLVEHHFSRLAPPVPRAELWDAAACLVVETAEHAARRGATARARLLELSHRYTPHDPLSNERAPSEELGGVVAPPGERGPATFLSALAGAMQSGASLELTHLLVTRDHVTVSSRWQVGA
jgi:3-oxoacyl-(acyl-carrier-protein) synthase